MAFTPELLARLDLSDEAREVLQREAVEIARQQTELAELRQGTKKETAKARVQKFSDIGFKDSPGFLRVIDALSLADDGHVSVTLLADGGFTKNHMTIGQVLDLMLEALPKDDKGQLNLAAKKADLLENPLDKRPDLKPDPTEADPNAKQLSGDELLAQWKQDAPGLELDLPLPATPTTAAAA